jgi:tetratricopeptide (TPR) repeat protein
MIKRFILVSYIIILSTTSVLAEKENYLDLEEILNHDLDALIDKISDNFANAEKTGSNQPGQDIRELIDRGKTQLRSENWSEAEETFSTVTGLNPGSDDGWEGYLLSIRGSGDYNALLAASEQAAEQNSSSVSAWIYKGIALIGLNRSEDALSAFDQALSMDPSGSMSWYYKGIALNNLKRDDEAIPAFEKAIQIDPSYKAAHPDKEKVSRDSKEKTLDGIDIIDDSSEIIQTAESMPQKSIPTISRVSPDSYSDCWIARVSLTGRGFENVASVSLTKTGSQPISADYLNVLDTSNLDCHLPVTGKGVSQKPWGAGETWNVVITNKDGQSQTVANGFSIKPGDLIFDNSNNDTVSNNPDIRPQFKIDALKTKIRTIETYHWNEGRGSPPGTISLKHSDGTTYGPWNALAVSQGEVPNAYWRVNPDTDIKMGTYSIIDSNPETWSHNTGSNNAGFALVRGCRC